MAAVLDDVRGTTSTLAKIDHLSRYLITLADDDLRRACTFLSGAPFAPGDPRRLGVGWVAIADVLRELTHAPEPEFHATYRTHGDLGDAAASLLARYPPPPALFHAPLRLDAVERGFEAMAAAQGAASRRVKTATLRGLLQDATPREAAYLVKIMTSDMRVGLREGLLLPAIASAFGRDAADVRRAALLVADPGEIAVRARVGALERTAIEPGRPFRFMLASPINAPKEAFQNSVSVLWVEDKYDGIRVQVHRTAVGVAILSRTLDDVTAAFPELAASLEALATAYVLDGEIVAWKGTRPLPFFRLQQRLQRRDPRRLVEEIPVVLYAFDLLHLDGHDLLAAPLSTRRAALETLRPHDAVRLSMGGLARTPEDLDARFHAARDAGNEGIVMKRLDSPYQPGRRGRLWTKWKPGVGTLDVVIVAAEYGHGKRAGILSDYTFAVRDGARLATIGKAYSGLTDGEIARLSAWFHQHTRRDLGALRLVDPAVVLEVAFDAVTRSERHDSGFALRFPRIVRIREDKSAGEIDTLAAVRSLHARLTRANGVEDEPSG
ncbi:MAG TPA: ATP-dependent DNA ligase [bacterium]|nr:ATP-dependent DNA ligase [bacterium]